MIVSGGCLTIRRSRAGIARLFFCHFEVRGPGSLRRIFAGADGFSRQSDRAVVAVQYAKLGLTVRPANVDHLESTTVSTAIFSTAAWLSGAACNFAPPHSAIVLVR